MKETLLKECPYCTDGLIEADLAERRCPWCGADLHEFLKRGTITFLVIYRGEIGAYIEAPSRDAAIEQFVNGEAEYFLLGDPWDEFIEAEPIE